MKRTKVAILLCTYQGEKYLAEQLDSFGTQTHADFQVWVSDDGSKDRTLSILETYAAQNPSWGISLMAGPKRGSAANFLSLTCTDCLSADYYAYSDQDDIWEPDKLERAVSVGT